MSYQGKSIPDGQVPDWVRSWLAGCQHVEHMLSFSAFMVLIAVVFADVVSRELAGTGLHWAREVGVFANFVVVMVGFGLASASGSHLRPRFADRWLPAAWDPALKRIGEALMAVFCAGFALVAIMVVAETRELGERSSVLRLAIWPLQALIPVVFALGAARHALYAAFPGVRPAQTPVQATAASPE